MAYFKLSDLVELDEVREALEVDAKPRFDLKSSEDSVNVFWDAVFAAPDIVHPEIEDEGDQEDFNGDETSENARTFWDPSLDFDD